MSYILDALKKAESERKLGSVPDVYAPAPTAAATGGKQTRLPWILLAAVLLASLSGLIWLQPWQSKAPATSATQNPTPITQLAAPAIVQTPTPVAPPIAPQVKQASAIVDATSKPKPVAPHLSVPTPAHVAQASPAIVTPPAQIKAPVVAEALHEEDSIGTARNLPQNIQAELPTFVVNGYIYARNPMDRSVLINQKLLHEGDQITPELVLEKMLPKGAILNYKGYRYRVSF